MSQFEGFLGEAGSATWVLSEPLEKAYESLLEDPETARALSGEVRAYLLLMISCLAYYILAGRDRRKRANIKRILDRHLQAMTAECQKAIK